MVLWLLALILPLAILGWRTLNLFDALRRTTIILLRCLVLTLLIVALAQPQSIRERRDITLIALIDVSQSVRLFPDLPSVVQPPLLQTPTSPASDTATLSSPPDSTSEPPTPPPPAQPFTDNLDVLRWWIAEAARPRGPDDRLGIIAFDGRALAVAAPSRSSPPSDFGALNLQQVGEGTNIAEAIQLAASLFGPDSARRIVLLSDGHQTQGDALAACLESLGSGRAEGLGAGAEGRGGSEGGGGRAETGRSGGVPVDTVHVPYAIAHEMMVERVETPASARSGQRISVRVILRATEESNALLTLFNEDEAIDLNGPAPGSARLVHLIPGLNVEVVPVLLAANAINRFRAVIEPTADSLDTVLINNSARSLTMTPTAGAILYADGWADSGESSDQAGADSTAALPSILADAGFAVRVVSGSALPTDMLELQAYDLIILDDVRADELSPAQHALLIRYIRDLGGGLLMLGGYDGFGAGGWTDTPLAGALPVNMQVPEELRVPTAALALVIDRSGSMGHIVPGPRRSQQEIANDGAAAAIETLDPMDWITVIGFDSSYSEVVPLARRGDGSAALAAVQRIRPDGGTNMGPALEHAVDQLLPLDAEVKHIVCLTDGRSQPHDFNSTIARAQAAGITVSAIAVGDDIDADLLKSIAVGGGGRYYQVRNASILPRIFVKDIQIVRRPLIREVTFAPLLRQTGSPMLEGIPGVPALRGYVLTQTRRVDAVEPPAPSSSPAATAQVLPPAEYLLTAPTGEPILATWQFGLGRATAYTSDVHSRWGSEWLAWPGFRRLWTQIARATARPLGSDRYELTTAIADGRLRISLVDQQAESTSDSPPDPASASPASVPARLYRPDGREEIIRLPRTGPGRYSVSIPASAPGAYVVAATPAQADGQLALILGGTNLSDTAEFVNLQSNPNLLMEISRLTGGRTLSLTDPSAADLFNHEMIEPIRTASPLWPVLLWAGLILFLIDVALRRLAWHSEAVAESVAGLWESDEPAQRSRASAAAATAAQLRARSEPRRPAEVFSAAQTSPTDSAAIAEPSHPPVPTPAPARTQDPAIMAARRKSALAALRGEGLSPSRPRANPLPESPPSDAPPATDTTAGLLRAKRRARNEDDGTPSHPPPPPDNA